jgi:hypothetical protein
MKKIFILIIVSLFYYNTFAQQNRIFFNDQQLFLSGANLAWVNFANDLGPAPTNFDVFADVMMQMHDNGGNTLRWWLHTNGTATPEFNSLNFVVGPGSETISDLKKVLDIAWEREIGLNLCLWSFDMLRASNNSTVLGRNNLLLTDTYYTNAYINNCLIPMVDSLKGHPAIITWEIFNEPEGMSNEFGWPGILYVPMSAIQRFINLCAGAIHRTDSTALVTSGAWSFQALTDVPTTKMNKISKSLSTSEKEKITSFINQKYKFNFSVDEVMSQLEKISLLANFNYYSDTRLIATGGDSAGTLDFFSVHYYVGLGSTYSPFLRPAYAWGLTKPIVVAEFAMSENNGVPKDQLFDKLYQTGYAGSLPWSWTDVNLSSHSDMLAGMKFMWNNYRSDVDINGISGEYPYVTILYPDTNAVFTDVDTVVIIADAFDNDGQIISVEFFIDDNIKIGECDTIPYTFNWTNIVSDNYVLYAIATDNNGNKRISNRVPIQVGTPPMVHLEAEFATRQGTGMSIKSDPLASNGLFVDIATQTGTITWTLPNVPLAGFYEIIFGYKCFYNAPKEQYINVNGSRVDTLNFEGNISTWLEKGMMVNLTQGLNTIQMELFWGWMYLDYLAVPSTITGVDVSNEMPIDYSLEQNYPNPFNPVTTISYSIPAIQNVKLIVYDILGREISTLVNEEKPAGTYSVTFNANRLSSGVYLYRLEAGIFNKVNKMIYLK